MSLVLLHRNGINHAFYMQLAGLTIEDLLCKNKLIHIHQMK